MNGKFMTPFLRPTGKFSKKPVEVKRTLQPVPEEDADLEAEKGEIVVTSDNTGLPSTFIVAGKRHSQGGTPLSLAPNSFIFSRDNSMKIKDENILKMFGMGNRPSGYTPAEIAKKYDINKFRKVLADKDSDKIQKDSAESMIRNYNEKLAQLALIQESHKGFNAGIPMIAMPYLMTNNLDPSQLIQQQNSDEGDQENVAAEQQRFGGQTKFNYFKKGGENKAPSSNRGMVEIQYAGPLKKVDFSRDDSDEGEETLRRVKVIKPRTFQQGGGYNPVERNKKWFTDYEDAILKSNMTFHRNDPKWGYLMQYNAIHAPDSIKYSDKFYNKAQEDLELIDSKRPKLQEGGGTKKKGTPTYDPTEASILKKLFPNVILPQDIVEAKQKKSGVGFGRFDKAAADKNWAWYGKPIDWSNPQEVGAAQTAYNKRIYDKLIAAGHPQDAAQKMVERIGFDPNADGPNALDNKAGKYTETRVDIDPVPVEQAAKVVAGEAKKSAPLSDLKSPGVQGNNQQTPADFWLQDIIKTAGAAGDQYRIKKYLPWQAQASTFLPQATFYDPTRELAANAEQSNIASQTAGMFGSPQQLAANLTAIQGQAGENAANILGKYNNLNVGAANQNEAQRTGILNQASANKAEQATNLYDKTVIANQNFDNAKAMARQQLRQSFLDALTNRAQTQALNAIQHQFRVDPKTGGTRVFYKPGTDFADENYQNQLMNFTGMLGSRGSSIAAQIKELTDQGYSRAEAIDALKLQSGK